MKRLGLAVASVLLFGCSLFAFGQTEPPTNPQPSCTIIAVIDSSRFGDEKNGIIRYVYIMKRLNRELYVLGHPTTAEKRLKSLIDQMPMDGPKMSEAKIAEIERLRDQAKRESEDREAIYERARKEALRPIEQDIATALKEFAKKRGIMLVMDVVSTPGLLMADPATEITDAFIAEFNSKNPLRP